jgi:hypothetical protein
MKLWRAVPIGFVLWAIIFIELSITKMSIGLSVGVVYTLHYLLLIPFGIFCAWLYYRHKDDSNGFAVGFVILLTGIILDCLITVPFFIKSYAVYFGNFYLWAGFVELILIFGLFDLIASVVNK